jgi:hypothetical protein
VITGDQPGEILESAHPPKPSAGSPRLGIPAGRHAIEPIGEFP